MSSKTCFKSNHTNYVAGAIPPDMYQTCQPNMNGNQTYLSQLNCNYTTDFQKQFYETWSDYITNSIELKSDTEVKYKWFVHFKLHIKSFKDMGLSGSWFRCRCHNGPSRCTATVNNCLFPDDAYCYECTQFDRSGECCCECDACFQRQGHPHVSLRFNVKDIQYIIMWNSATTAWPTDGWPTIVISCYSMSIHDTSWVQNVSWVPMLNHKHLWSIMSTHDIDYLHLYSWIITNTYDEWWGHVCWGGSCLYLQWFGGGGRGFMKTETILACSCKYVLVCLLATVKKLPLGSASTSTPIELTSLAWRYQV